MPIISKVGRQAKSARFVIALFYLIIALGAVTMVYPLLLMIASSTTGPQDMNEFRLVPRFLYKSDALFLRVATEKYLGGSYISDLYGVSSDYIPLYETAHMGEFYRRLNDQVGWDVATAPTNRIARLTDFDDFLKHVIPGELLQIGFEQEFGIPRFAEREWWKFIRETHHDDLKAMNESYGENWDDFLLVPMPKERVAYRNWVPPQSKRYAEYQTFKKSIRENNTMLLQSLNGDYAWRQHVVNQYDNSLQAMNLAWGTNYASFDDLLLPLKSPANPAIAQTWSDFVRRKWSPRHIVWNGATVDRWREYLRDVYTTRAKTPGPSADAESEALRLLREAHRSSARGWSDIQLPTAAEMTGALSADFYAFIRGDGDAYDYRPDTTSATLITCRSKYADYLQQKFGTVDRMNEAYGQSLKSFAEVTLPFAEYDWWQVQSNAWKWRKYFITNNFSLVFDRILFRGDALVNTAAFVILSLAVQLTVNPACAYALSRFRLSYMSKVLVFLLATMAFPAEVTMIPGFLMLRNLGMLNTFAALVLPGAANGFMIFILKGFFDSLPREIYEAAQIDGASEWRIFAQVTMPLSKPVLAFVALGSFMGVYTSFLFAMVICQDSRMWTLMVWIYQLQGSVHASAQMAALLVVMLPTLVVLAACQRVIMRGVVLPQLH